MDQSWASTRAGDAERARTADVVRAAYAEGRLDQDEHDERIARALSATTYADLRVLVADLPVGPVPLPTASIANPAGPDEGTEVTGERRSAPDAAFVFGSGLVAVVGLAATSGFGFPQLVSFVSAVFAVAAGHRALRRLLHVRSGPKGPRGWHLTAIGAGLGYVALLQVAIAVVSFVVLVVTGPAVPTGW